MDRFKVGEGAQLSCGRPGFIYNQNNRRVFSPQRCNIVHPGVGACPGCSYRFSGNFTIAVIFPARVKTYLGISVGEISGVRHPQGSVYDVSYACVITEWH